MMEVVVTTGAISRTKLQSDHHHQQTNIQFPMNLFLCDAVISYVICNTVLSTFMCFCNHSDVSGISWRVLESSWYSWS